MAELVVDHKHRVTLPKKLREALAVTVGSKLEAEQKGGEIIIRPAVAVKEPTEAIWGLTPMGRERSPKRKAREAIARRKTSGR